MRQHHSRLPWLGCGVAGAFPIDQTVIGNSITTSVLFFQWVAVIGDMWCAAPSSDRWLDPSASET
jgi:hypothetical protein